MDITELNLPGHLAYRVVFSSPRPPLVIAQARDNRNGSFWTSVPEGRQKEAEGIGKLITEYFENKK